MFYSQGSGVESWAYVYVFYDLFFCRLRSSRSIRHMRRGGSQLICAENANINICQYFFVLVLLAIAATIKESAATFFLGVLYLVESVVVAAWNL